MKKFYLPIGILILFICAIGFLSLRSDVPTEPIVIYKTTTPIKQSVTPKVSEPMTVSASMPIETVEETHDSTSEVSEVPLSDTLSKYPDYKTIDSKSIKPSDGPDITSTDESEVEYQKLAQELVDDWNEFASSLSAKYELLFDLENLDIVSKTPKGRREIVKQAKAMQNETLDYVVSLFSEISYEDREEVLRLSEQHLRSSNTGLSDKHIAESFEMIRSRIK